MLLRRHNRLARVGLVLCAGDTASLSILLLLNDPQLPTATAGVGTGFRVIVLLLAFATAASGAGLLTRVSDSPQALRTIGWHAAVAAAALAARVLQLALTASPQPEYLDHVIHGSAEAFAWSCLALVLWIMTMILGYRSARSAWLIGLFNHLIRFD
ncbi:MAG: hypothetical protein RIF32_01940 [Leptospirales bacterium]|jgi:hypothetical protein